MATEESVQELVDGNAELRAKVTQRRIQLESTSDQRALDVKAERLLAERQELEAQLADYDRAVAFATGTPVLANDSAAEDDTGEPMTATPPVVEDVPTTPPANAVPEETSEAAHDAPDLSTADDYNGKS